MKKYLIIAACLIVLILMIGYLDDHLVRKRLSEQVEAYLRYETDGGS